MSQLDTLQALAEAAKPLSEEEWGSERQTAAENAFFDAVRDVVPASVWSDFEA